MVKKKTYAIALPYTPKSINLSEALKSEVDLDPVKFPKDLGESHPFEFSQCEKTCAKFGLAKAGVDKHLDFIISPGFYITCENKNAETLLKGMIEETGFTLTLRDWIQEGLIKGNGFMEISVEKDTVNLRVINANNMYVNRDINGNILGYNQYVGGMNKFDMKKVIPFKPNQVAHLPIGKISDSAYGLGIVRPTLKIVENIVRSETDMHILLTRKANNPIICKVGTPEEPASQADVSAIGAKFEYLNNLHEWAFDHRVDFSVVDFGAISDKFVGPLEHDLKTFYMALQVPAVIMGDSQQNEGIAKVQLDVFERRIQSLQENIERIIETQIFKPFLLLNGFDVHAEINWGQPSEESINDRIMKLTTLLQNISLSPVLRSLVERDIAQNLGYDEKDIALMVGPSEADKEAALKQPEVPGVKPMASESLIKESWDWKESESDITIQEFVNLQELSGFNYKEYIRAILKQVNKDGFTDLKAINEAQLKDGLLSESQIESLRTILLQGFKENKPLFQIENDISELGLKDRLQEGKLIVSAEFRPNMIARTETVRLANEGIVDMYKDNGIEKVRWLASISDRTCPQCLDLDGTIYPINELSVGVNQPPLHPSCRCALLSVKE